MTRRREDHEIRLPLFLGFEDFVYDVSVSFMGLVRPAATQRKIQHRSSCGVANVKQPDLPRMALEAARQEQSLIERNLRTWTGINGNENFFEPNRAVGARNKTTPTTRYKQRHGPRSARHRLRNGLV